MLNMLSNLSGLIIPSILCLSPVVAWLTFSISQHEKLRDKNIRYSRLLYDISDVLAEISKWTANEYNENSHNFNWHHPNWKVHRIPVENLSRINKSDLLPSVDEALLTSLIRVEVRSEIINSELLKHNKELSNLPRGALERIANTLDEIKEEMGPIIFDSDVNPLSEHFSDRFPEDYAYTMSMIYDSNKYIHVNLIGTKTIPNCLQSAMKEADTTYANAIKEENPFKIPSLMYAGHILGILFGLIGAIYLLTFISTLLMNLHPFISTLLVIFFFSSSFFIINSIRLFSG